MSITRSWHQISWFILDYNFIFDLIELILITVKSVISRLDDLLWRFPVLPRLPAIEINVTKLPSSSLLHLSGSKSNGNHVIIFKLENISRLKINEYFVNQRNINYNIIISILR